MSGEPKGEGTMAHAMMRAARGRSKAPPARDAGPLRIGSPGDSGGSGPLAGLELASYRPRQH